MHDGHLSQAYTTTIEYNELPLKAWNITPRRTKHNKSADRQTDRQTVASRNGKQVEEYGMHRIESKGTDEQRLRQTDR